MAVSLTFIYINDNKEFRDSDVRPRGLYCSSLSLQFVPSKGEVRGKSERKNRMRNKRRTLNIWMVVLCMALIAHFSLRARAASGVNNASLISATTVKILNVQRWQYFAQDNSSENDTVSSQELIRFYAPKEIKTRGIGGVRTGRSSGPAKEDTPVYDSEGAEARRRFRNILFDVNSSRIKGSSYRQLDEVGKALRTIMDQYPGALFIIEGYTDSTGSETYNRSLSYHRAEAVKDYIVSRFGLDDSRITVHGFGEDRPVATNETEYGRSQNRRVEITRR